MPEPIEPDDTWAMEGEGCLSWLLRSTLPPARAAREFLNINLRFLPRPFADKLRRDLGNRWKSAFFELIVARTLQVLGGTIKVEEMTPSGRNPDFLVDFEDGSIVVEATAPIFEGEVQAEQADHGPLKGILEGLAPPGYSIFIHELPRIGPAGSRKEFKTAAGELLKPPFEVQDNELTRRKAILSNGVLEVSLVRTREGSPPIVGGPGYGIYSDSISRIKRAVKRKRPQVRTAQSPVLLAISASGLTSSFEDFDRALFGESCLALGYDGKPPRNEFRANGVFGRPSDAQPTYAGVMGFTEVGFRCMSDPILWLHPRFAGHLPGGLLALESRVLDVATGIRVNPAQVRRALEALGPVAM